MAIYVNKNKYGYSTMAKKRVKQSDGTYADENGGFIQVDFTKGTEPTEDTLLINPLNFKFFSYDSREGLAYGIHIFDYEVAENNHSKQTTKATPKNLQPVQDDGLPF